MPKSFQVLIIEDDKTLATSIQKALKNEGIDTYVAQSPEAAQTLCSHCDFSLVVADCMLPRMDGVTLIQKLKPTFSHKPNILLMTGVFKDKGFNAEAIKKTGALEVIQKPFDLKDFVLKIKGFESRFETEQAPPAPTSLSDFWSKPNPPLKDILKFYKDRPSASGLEVPFIFSLLTRNNWLGAMYIQLPTGHSGVVYFSGGEVVQVLLDDAKSLLGHLLMDLGFVEPEDLETALASEDKTLIGQKLISQLSLSPHGLDLALSEQSAIRLSQLVTSQMVHIRFAEGAQSPNQKTNKISQKRLEKLYFDWGSSKFESSFLIDFFDASLDLPLSTSSLQQTGTHTTLKQMLDRRPMGEVISLLLTRQIVPALVESRTFNTENLKAKYSKLEQSLKTKNLFEVLGLSPKSLSREIEKAYLTLKGSMSTNRASVTDPELLEIFERISNRIERAYEVLSDDVKRPQYIHQMEIESQQELMNKEPEYDLAVALLNDEKYKDAYFILKKLHKDKFNFPDLHSYLAIAKSRSEKVPLTEADLVKVSPENRQSGAYMLAKALSHKSAKNYPMAIQYFKKALVYHPQSRIAHNEIASCHRRMERQAKSAHKPLFGFVGDLLGSQGQKKKKSA